MFCVVVSCLFIPSCFLLWMTFLVYLDWVIFFPQLEYLENSWSKKLPAKEKIEFVKKSTRAFSSLRECFTLAETLLHNIVMVLTSNATFKGTSQSTSIIWTIASEFVSIIRLVISCSLQYERLSLIALASPTKIVVSLILKPYQPLDFIFKLRLILVQSW